MKTSDLILYGIIGLAVVLILWRLQEFLKGTGETLEKAATTAVGLPAGLITQTGQAVAGTASGLATTAGNLPGQIIGPVMDTMGITTDAEDTRPYLMDYIVANPIRNVWHKLFG